MTTTPAQISWKLSLVMSLLLLVPGVSFAANEGSLLLAEAEPERPGLLSEQDLLGAQEQARARRSIHPALRVAAEIGATSVTAIAAGVGGITLVLETCDAFSVGLGCFDQMAIAMVGAVVLGAPFGTWWGGKLTGGQGTFLGALLGTGAGFVVGAGAAALVYNEMISIWCYPLGILIGSVVGYEVSHGLASAPEAPLASASVQPVLAFSDRGAVLGLNGSF